MKNETTPPALPALRVIQAVNLGGMTESAFHIQDPEANMIWATCRGNRWTTESEALRRAELLAALPEVTAERDRLREEVRELRVMLGRFYAQTYGMDGERVGDCISLLDFEQARNALSKTNPKA